MEEKGLTGGNTWSRRWLRRSTVHWWAEWKYRRASQHSGALSWVPLTTEKPGGLLARYGAAQDGRGTDPQKGPGILPPGLFSSLEQICAKAIINLKTYIQAKQAQSHAAIGRLGFIPRSEGLLILSWASCRKLSIVLEYGAWVNETHKPWKPDVWWLKAQALKSDWVPYPGSATCLLCGLGQVGSHLCALLSFSVKWE